MCVQLVILRVFQHSNCEYMFLSVNRTTPTSLHERVFSNCFTQMSLILQFASFGLCTISEQKHFTRLSCGGIISDHFNLRLRYHKRTLHSSLHKKHSTEACPELSWARLVTFKAEEFTIQHISFNNNANSVTETEDSPATVRP